MSAVMTAPAPAPVNERRCRIEDVFSGNFIELLMLAPRNPCVRGLILAQTRKMPPSECQTFEALKDWVEANCERKLCLPRPSASSGEGIAVTVEFSETEYGRASYSVPRSGSDEFQLAEEELLELVQEAIDADDNLETVVQNITEKVRDEAWDRCEPNLEDNGDYEYEAHDSTDSDDAQLDFSQTQIRDRLAAFLRQRHPQLLEALT